MSASATADPMKMCKWCLLDIRRDERGWLLAWWNGDDEAAVPDPYACPRHPAHEPDYPAPSPVSRTARESEG